MEAADGEEMQQLHGLYETGGESAVRERRDEVERQKDRVLEELRETTNRYLTALAGVHSAQQLIQIYDPFESCGEVHHFAGTALWKVPIHVQLEIPNDVEIPIHVAESIEAVEENGKHNGQDEEDECSSGYWRREKTAVAAITEEEEVVFRVSDQEPLERLHEEAKAKRQQLCAQVQDRHEEFEQLRLAFNLHEDFLSKSHRGEVEPNEPLSPEVRRRELRGIAEKYTEEVEAVRDYLNQCPDHAWPDSRTAAFDSVFPDEDGRTVYERFRRRWQRAGDLDFPSTVEELHEACKTALKLREEFPVESP
ncbi:peptidyl-tRNA hydrolase [Salinibacter ruber]|uniref:hypothetical protein n=1 Tax=Salinibacter ruber TaxID=146919 RepID=UPI002167C017|nr:hypothetical protein [Salinibacter ruber]MCS4155052.1 peptidyl-tRNA hydrolase [Salinibacter ruber]